MEKESAFQLAQNMNTWLREIDWPEPLVIDSGNGYHLYYRINLDRDDDSLVKELLHGIAKEFSTKDVEVDPGFSSPAHLAKLPGTYAQKGENVKDRPHRKSGFENIPDEIIEVPKELLVETLSLLHTEKDGKDKKSDISSKSGAEWEKREWVEHHVPGAGTPKIKGDWLNYRTDCPLNEKHSGEAMLSLHKNGAIKWTCPHKSCDLNWGWNEIRDHCTPGWQKDLTRDIGLTEFGNAHRFARKNSHEFKYCYKNKSWYKWSGKQWKIDDSGAVERAAKKIIHTLYSEASQLRNDEERRTLVKWAQRSECSYMKKAIIDLAKSESDMTIAFEEFDTKKLLFNCKNGTLDFQNNELKSHSPEDFLSQIAPVEYDESAECPRWNDFLEEIFNKDYELISFLQRAIGYSLTGEISEHALFFLYGTGANGKSTFLNTIQKLMGDYARSAAPNLLMHTSWDQHPAGIADLKGARFVCTGEVNEDSTFSEAIVKQLTGGDRLKARHLYGQFFEFDPTHKIFIAANHKPRVRGNDYAMWRRIKLIPFAVQISEEKRDCNLLKKLEKELSGILNWAYLGYLEWRESGLMVPESVRRATNEYKSESDILEDFFRECCILDSSQSVMASNLYSKYRDWCETNGERPMSKNMLGRRLGNKGFRKKRIDGGNIQWNGIGVIYED